MIARVAKALNKDDKGFTLVELLVVIIIIGILAAIAIPMYLNQRNKGYDAAVKSDLKNHAIVAETNYVDTLDYASANIFKEGGAATGKALASKGTRYIGWANRDSYVVYGLSQSGKVFALSSIKGGTPEETTLTALPTAAQTGDLSSTGGTATAIPAWPTVTP